MARASITHLLLLSALSSATTDHSRGWFTRTNPRMDYDEWTPLGRGDPLKNDPTYDYVPPVLERVHYWMDPSKRTPDPPVPNSGLLVLGSTATEPPPPSTPQTADSRIDTMSLLDPFLKLMDVSKYSLGLGQSTVTYQPRPTYPPPGPPPPPLQRPGFRPPTLQRPPYTVLMPPPLPPEVEPVATSFATSTTTTTEAAVTDESTTLQGTTSTVKTLTTVLGNTENLYRPVAISMPEENLEPNEIRPTTSQKVPLPDDSSMILPIISMFNQHKHELGEFTATPTSEKHHHLDHLHHHHYAEGNKLRPWKDKGFRPTTLRPEVTSGPSTLTTDPMFRHYKQPSKPVQGPFYLIIQGHSKVKTYGASKNPINSLVSSNEINESEDKQEYYDTQQLGDGSRRGKKLDYAEEYFVDEDDAEIVQGQPVVEVSASFEAKSSENGKVFEELESAFPNSRGGSSKKRYLQGTGRKLLAVLEAAPLTTSVSVTSAHSKNTTASPVDAEQLGLESLIAFTDDYNSEDVINLLQKEEGQGSGVGAFIGSLFGRAVDDKEM